VRLRSADLSGDVMSIEVEATDVLVDLGEGVKALNGRLSCLHHLAMHTLRSPWDVLDLRCLQAHQSINQSVSQSINQSIKRSCLWDSAGESTWGVNRQHWKNDID